MSIFEEMKKTLMALSHDAFVLHSQRHKDFHLFLDEMTADFMACTGQKLSDTSIMEFMAWSHKQTTNPDKPGVKK